MRYIVKARFDDNISLEVSGRKHKDREQAEAEMERVKNDESLLKVGLKATYIVEVPAASGKDQICDIISICAARNGERCKDCIYQGERCEDLKMIYWVSKPMYIDYVDCDEETEE